MTAPISVLVVGGSDDDRKVIRSSLARRSAFVELAEHAAKAEKLVRRCRYDVIVLHGGRDELAWWDRARGSEAAGSRLILVTSSIDRELAMDALRRRVEDVFELPLEAGKLVARILRPAEAEAVTARETASSGGGQDLVGACAEMDDVKAVIERVAPLPATVLIEGETGTGKELVARRIHARSGRRGPFVPVNCGAIAPELLESELFGHTRGAFTSAHQGRDGLFVAARGGTLFLDEISEMPISMEVKLLRALEESAVRPVGADREITVDVRIVASTQHDLQERIRQGRFREDLFYRLNVIHLKLPPLRHRGDDIVELAEHFLASAAAEAGLNAPPLTRDIRTRLAEYPWPGNVRELKNLVERATMLGRFPDNEPAVDTRRPETGGGSGYPLDWTLEAVKQDHMRRVVDACEGNKSRAARRLAVSRKTLDRKLP